MLKFVRDMMHTGAAVPLLPVGTRMSEALVEMSTKSFGCVGITDRIGLLIGIITDGDLRRHMRPDLLDVPVEQVMTRTPKTLRGNQLASEALELFNSTKITAAIVVDGGKPVGIVHLHDLLRAGLA
jgi:arabinose-5-phosphate isomerase